MSAENPNIPNSEMRPTSSQSRRPSRRTSSQRAATKGASTIAPSPTRRAEPTNTGMAEVTILLTGVAEPNTAMPRASCA
jgi:hypothetical protein